MIRKPRLKRLKQTFKSVDDDKTHGVVMLRIKQANERSVSVEG